MPADKRKERSEARRLVEAEGRSLKEAAGQVGVDERTVRRWQKDDEARGDPWALGGQSAEQKARAVGLSDADRERLAEQARKAAALRWENRRRAEADAAGVMAGRLRENLLNTLPRYAASLLEEGSDVDTLGMRPQRLSASAKNLVVAYAVALDKADRLAGVDAAALAEDAVSDFAEVQTLFATIRDRPRSVGAA